MKTPSSHIDGSDDDADRVMGLCWLGRRPVWRSYSLWVNHCPLPSTPMTSHFTIANHHRCPPLPHCPLFANQFVHSPPITLYPPLPTINCQHCPPLPSFSIAQQWHHSSPSPIIAYTHVWKINETTIKTQRDTSIQFAWEPRSWYPMDSSQKVQPPQWPPKTSRAQSPSGSLRHPSRQSPHGNIQENTQMYICVWKHVLVIFRPSYDCLLF